MASKVYILIPTYNEDSAVLSRTVREVLHYGWNVVVIDDGSKIPVINDLFEGCNVFVLRHIQNLGQGAALETGMEFARRQNADAVVHFDADGQHPAAQIPDFLAQIEQGADVVVGSRFLLKEDMLAVPASRRFLIKIARILNFFFTGLWLSDAHNGFRALNSKALNAIHLQENRMAHATEIISQIHQNHLVLREIPVHIQYTEYSRKKGQKWFHSLKILVDILLNKLFS